MKTITFALQKGGVGKTSISVSCAVQLAQNGKKVLLIDGDTQGNTSSWLLTSLNKEFADCLIDNESIKDCITHTSIQNLDILATFGVGGKLKNYRDSAVSSNKPYLIKKLVAEVADSYDYCIFDTSPSNSPLERNIYLASDEIVPVLKLDQFSVDGLQIFTENLNEVKSDFDSSKPVFKSIVLNAKDSRIAFQNDTLKLFADMDSDKTIVVFPTDTAFNNAQKLNIPTQDVKTVKKETLQSLKELAECIA